MFGVVAKFSKKGNAMVKFNGFENCHTVRKCDFQRLLQTEATVTLLRDHTL